MTTLYKQGIVCSVCGTETVQTVIGSTNAFGSCDLDTRPPGMKRSTIHAWVQRCSGCGACAKNLSKVNGSAGDVVKRAGYKSQLSDTGFPEIANSFICNSMIDEYSGELVSATWALIQAAWVCDDVKSTAQAVICRKWAATMLRKTKANGQKVAQQPGVSSAILVDLLRRAGALDEAAQMAELASETCSEGVPAQVVSYQKKLIEAGDTGCHTIAEALDDADHTPLEADNADMSDVNWKMIQPFSSKRWWQFWKSH
jgi:hypothetical protein